MKKLESAAADTPAPTADPEALETIEDDVI